MQIKFCLVMLFLNSKIAFVKSDYFVEIGKEPIYEVIECFFQPKKFSAQFKVNGCEFERMFKNGAELNSYSKGAIFKRFEGIIYIGYSELMRNRVKFPILKIIK